MIAANACSKYSAGTSGLNFRIPNTHLPCSGSEGRILRLAASLAHAIPVDLQDALTGLDDHNTALTSPPSKGLPGTDDLPR